MSCLDDLNLVGLRNDCGEDVLTASSGYYVNDLSIPGLLELMAAAKDKSTATAQEEVIKQITNAKRLTLDLFRGHIGERYSAGTLLENETIGVYDPPRQMQSAQAFNVGVELKVQRNRYAQIQVHRIGIVTQSSVTVPVKAWDIYSGEELYSEDIATTAGVPTFANVEWLFAGRGEIRDIFIGYDATSVGTYRTLFGGVGCNSCNGGSMNLRHLQAYTRKKATGANPQGALTSQDGTSGLMLDVSLVCNMDNYICSYGPMLAPVVYYRAGQLICDYFTYSQRLSPKVAAYKEQWEALSGKYMDAWREQYEILLSNVSIPKGDCFKCQSKTQIISRLP